MHLGADRRGASGVIGVVLLLGFLVVLLSVYQAQVVPQENKQDEFEHSLTVQNDMLDLRNAILEADTSGKTTFATVDLGVRYPNRLIGVNPAPASGLLETSEPRPITVTDSDGNAVTGLCPSTDPIQSRTLTYTPGYNEYDEHPTIVYENSVLYLNFSGEIILLTDETLVQGNTVNLNPINTTLAEAGTEKASIEPRPGLTKSRAVTGATVTYPTELSEDTWETLLAEDLPPENVSVSNGQLSLHTSGKITVACAPVGLNNPPPGGSRSGAGVEINPAGPNDVEVRSFARPSNDVIEVTFNNTGTTDANVTEARIAFYHNPSDTGGDIGPINLIDQNGVTVIQMDILAPKGLVSPEIRFPGNETETTLTFENPGGEKFSQDDFFIIQLVFDNGQEGTYFIDVPA